MTGLSSGGFIVDPTDSEKAIAPSGKLAGRLYLLPHDSPRDIAAPTVHEIDGGTFLGFVDPTDWPFNETFIQNPESEADPNA